MMGKRLQIDDPKPPSGSEAPVRVLVADDHPLIRAGLVSTLAAEPGLLLVGEATNGDEAQHLCQEQQPDVLLLDLRMPGPSALETVACLCQYCPETKVLMLTAYDDEAHVRWLVEAGVAGYLLKDEAPAAVVRAIRIVMQGDSWFSRSVVDKLARPAPSEAPPSEKPALTERESEVLRLISKGLSNKKIAHMLGVKLRTVELHVSHLLEKLGVSSRVQAALWAKERGMEK